MKKVLVATLLLLLFGVYLFVFSAPKQPKLLVLWTGGGEQQWAKQFEKASKNLNWECKTACCPATMPAPGEQGLFDKEISLLPADQLVQIYQPDLVISLNHRCQQVSVDVKRYLAITGDDRTLFEATNPLCKQFFDYDALLYASPKIEKVKDLFRFSRKHFQGIEWYPSCSATTYAKTTPKKLFYCGFQWDRKRNSADYRKMFSLLDEQGYLSVYGPPERWDCAPHSRRGYIPFDGTSLSSCMRECGIALVLHANSHLDLGAPTARIFEAASSCCIIISDRNPFIEKEFGDSVLYINGQADGETLFSEINAHMKWIFSHQEEAEKMAKRTHQIFVEKFTLEHQLEHLMTLHNELLSKQKKSQAEQLPLFEDTDTKMSREALLAYCHQNPSKIYQDIFVGGKVIFQGVNICDRRYEVLKPILEGFRGNFSVLDLGAAQGYFSFRIATDFAKSSCVMVEFGNEKEKHYSHHQDMLSQLCYLNAHLENVSYRHKQVSVPYLRELNGREHYDLVLAMLVIHQVDRSMDVRKELIDELLKLGDQVVLEVSNDVAPELLDYVKNELVRREGLECQYLGEVIRCHDPENAYDGLFPDGKGLFFLLKEKGPTSHPS